MSDFETTDVEIAAVMERALAGEWVDYSAMNDDELRAAYAAVIDAGADEYARGFSMGPAVMEASIIKGEARKRGVEVQ